MKLLSLAILSLCLVFAPTAHCLSIESQFVAKITTLTSPDQIQNARIHFRALLIAHQACRLQLRAKLIPSACYHSLRLERQWGMNLKLANLRQLERRLDLKCLTATQALHTQVHTEERTYLSPFCTKELQRAEKIVAYRQNSNAWSEN